MEGTINNEGRSSRNVMELHAEVNQLSSVVQVLFDELNRRGLLTHVVESAHIESGLHKVKEVWEEYIKYDEDRLRRKLDEFSLDEKVILKRILSE